MKMTAVAGDKYFHYVYCTQQILDTACTGNLDVYTLFRSHVYLLQLKVSRLISFILYICFQTDRTTFMCICVRQRTYVISRHYNDRVHVLF